MCERSVFLLLPSEVRLLIYRLVLPYSIYYEEFEVLDSPVRWHRGLCPSILFVNKKLYCEASQLLYKENYFSIYLRHPTDARLPMNESRPDPESFVLFSPIDRSWAHPRNRKLPLSILRRHANLSDIRKVYLSVHSLDGLIGVDAYMRRSSLARSQGIGVWLAKCAARGDHLSPEENDRMAYVYNYKEPIDEVGMLLRHISRIEFLAIAINRRQYGISFLSYLLEKILETTIIEHARCYYVPETGMGTQSWADVNTKDRLLALLRQSLESVIESPAQEGRIMRRETAEMYRLLQAIRKRQSLQNEHEQGCLYLDPQDSIIE